MQRLLYGLAIANLCQPFALVQAQTPLNPVIPVALPVKATVWLKAGGSTSGQVKGFDASKQMFTLGNQPLQVAQVSKVVFDRKALAYRSDGKLIIRGEDNAKAKQSTWQNVSLTAFQVKDPKLGQAQVNLSGVMKPIEVRGIQSVAVNSVYIVDEIQFQPAGKMMIKVTASDR